MPGKDLSLSDSMCHQQNVGTAERWLSIVAGSGLALYGLKQNSMTRLVGIITGGALVYRGVSGFCSVYNALGVNTCDHQRPGVQAQHGSRVLLATHISKSKQELYEYWRDLKNLPHVMKHLESITPLSDKKSRWVAIAPFGKRLTWEAEIIADRPGELIAWQSLPGSQVDTAGSIHFRDPPFHQGTEIVVSLKYDPLGGKMIANIADFFGQGLESRIREDLRTFKQFMESGEISTNSSKPKTSKVN